jgi:hypothetical protein
MDEAAAPDSWAGILYFIIHNSALIIIDFGSKQMPPRRQGRIF